MGKKKKKEKKIRSDKKPVEQSENFDRNVSNEEVGEFNFLGLPQRDLKKNLGCG